MPSRRRASSVSSDQTRTRTTGWDVASSETDAGVAPGDEKEDPFRDKLDLDAAQALLLAAARAVHWMPALRMMGFVLDSPPGVYELEVEYMAGGRGGGGTAELVFERHPDFHPDEGGCADLEGSSGGTCGRWACGCGQGLSGVVTVSGVQNGSEQCVPS